MSLALIVAFSFSFCVSSFCFSRKVHSSNKTRRRKDAERERERDIWPFVSSRFVIENKKGKGRIKESARSHLCLGFLSSVFLSLPFSPAIHRQVRSPFTPLGQRNVVQVYI